MYGVILFPVWLVFIINGISLLAVSYATGDIMQQVCSGENSTDSDVVNLLTGYS